MKHLVVIVLALALFAGCKKEAGNVTCSDAALKEKFDSCKILCRWILDKRSLEFDSCGNNKACFAGVDTVATKFSKGFRIDSASACFATLESYRYLMISDIAGAIDIDPALNKIQLADYRKRVETDFAALDDYLK